MVIKRVLSTVFITFWSVFVLMPILWALVTSFKPPEAVDFGATFLPFVDFTPTLLGWESIFGIGGGNINLVPALFNSIIVTFGGAAISLVLGTVSAYGLSRFAYKLGFIRNNDIVFFFVSQRIMPPIVLSFPFFLMLRDLGLLDSHLGLILVSIGGLMPIVVWLMVDFFNGIPRELDEMAMLEGYSPFEAFLRVILPLTAPGLTVAGMFAVIFGWNDFFYPLVLTFGQVVTLPLAIVALNATITPYWTLSAAAIFAILPLIAFAFAMERFLSKGSLSGAVR
jgi:multiple sugar transport system permease protein